MITNKDFRFNAFISAQQYNNKFEAINAVRGFDYEKQERIKDKMSFRDLSLNLDEFADYILNGYSYCNLFSTKQFENRFGKASFPYKDKTYWGYSVYRNGKNKGCFKVQFKQDKYFLGSYYISVDIDNTRFGSIEEYINKLTYKPTFSYSTYSDSEFNRKFRMVYILDRMMDFNQFKFISQIIHKQISIDVNEYVADKCGEKPSQYFNGTINGENYKTYNVYNVTDFDSSVLEYEEEIDTSDLDDILGFDKEETKETINDSVKSAINNLKLKKEESHNTISETGHLLNEEETIEFDNVMLKDMEIKSYGRFMYKYGKTYNFYYRTEKEEWLENEFGMYQYTDENFIGLYWNRTKLKDGNKRRKRLYSRAALRRIIKPSVTPSELLFNLYVDREKFFDNSDEVLSIERLKYNVELAFKKTIEELKEEFRDIIKLSNDRRPSIIVRNDNKLKKKESHNTISETGHLLNGSKNNKLSVRNSVLKRGKTKYCIGEIRRYYNPESSIRKNLSVLNENGIKISRGTLLTYIEKYELNNAEKCPVIAPNEFNDNLYQESQEKPLETITEDKETDDLINDLSNRLRQEEKENLFDIDMYDVFKPLQMHLINHSDKNVKEYGFKRMENMIKNINNKSMLFESQLEIIYNSTKKYLYNNIAI